MWFSHPTPAASGSGVHGPNSKYQPAAPNADTRATDVPVRAYKTTVSSARHVALQHRNMAASKHRCKIPKTVPAVGVTYWYKKAKKHRTRVE